MAIQKETAPEVGAAGTSVVVVIPMTPLLDDNNFAVIAITVPAAIVVTITVPSFDFNLGVLRLRWRCSERHSQPNSRHRSDC
jgi:hypothetical protein